MSSYFTKQHQEVPQKVATPSTNIVLFTEFSVTCKLLWPALYLWRPEKLAMLAIPPGSTSKFESLPSFGYATCHPFADAFLQLL
jgi:hypothetical protein